jgi:hypothetical protein
MGRRVCIRRCHFCLDTLQGANVAKGEWHGVIGDNNTRWYVGLIGTLVLTYVEVFILIGTVYFG